MCTSPPRSSTGCEGAASDPWCSLVDRRFAARLATRREHLRSATSASQPSCWCGLPCVVRPLSVGCWFIFSMTARSDGPGTVCTASLLASGRTVCATVPQPPAAPRPERCHSSVLSGSPTAPACWTACSHHVATDWHLTFVLRRSLAPLRRRRPSFHFQRHPRPWCAYLGVLRCWVLDARCA